MEQTINLYQKLLNNLKFAICFFGLTKSLKYTIEHIKNNFFLWRVEWENWTKKVFKRKITKNEKNKKKNHDQ
jgi:putative component of membrane protein insertase Oxa1/YidC/SpoIIIJ protein YidD